MTTKLERAKVLVNRLASTFRVIAPDVLVFRGGGARGYYHKTEGERVFFTNLARTRTRTESEHRARIELQERSPLETLAHEFGHHLDELRRKPVSEPPVALSEVREALGYKRWERLEFYY